MVYTTHYNEDLGDGFLLGFPVSRFPTLFLFLFLFHSVTGEGCNIQGPLGNGSDLFIFFQRWRNDHNFPMPRYGNHEPKVGALVDIPSLNLEGL
jgi:hypothetical protein